jgi:hypothetical protein
VLSTRGGLDGEGGGDDLAAAEPELSPQPAGAGRVEVNVHGQVVIDGGEHRSLAGGGRLAGLPRQRRDGDARVGEECGVADQDVAALDRGVDAPAGDGGEALGRRQRQAAVAGCGRGLR